MALSERVEAIAKSEGFSPGDVRMIEMQIARAEEKILRIEQRYSSWTRPDLRLRMTEEIPGGLRETMEEETSGD